jgi:hypothetical protein
VGGAVPWRCGHGLGARCGGAASAGHGVSGAALWWCGIRWPWRERRGAVVVCVGCVNDGGGKCGRGACPVLSSAAPRGCGSGVLRSLSSVMRKLDIRVAGDGGRLVGLTPVCAA